MQPYDSSTLIYNSTGHVINDDLNDLCKLCYPKARKIVCLSPLIRTQLQNIIWVYSRFMTDKGKCKNEGVDTLLELIVNRLML